ncbi:hypothetical protein ACIQZO_09245 [Streptomyces sp. NPDC097617]
MPDLPGSGGPADAAPEGRRRAEDTPQDAPEYEGPDGDGGGVSPEPPD